MKHTESHPFFGQAVLAAAGFALLATSAQASTVLAQYDFTGGSLAPTQEASGFTASPFSRGSAFTTPASFTTDYIYTSGNLTPANEADAVTNNAYFEFTITPDSGTYSLASLDFSAAFFIATDTYAGYQSNFFVRSNVDGYTTTLDTFTENGQRNTQVTGIVFTSHSIVLSDLSAYQDLTGPVTFRIYVYDNVSGGSYNSAISDVTVTAIPETSSYALILGLAGMLAFLQHRRRQRKQ